MSIIHAIFEDGVFRPVEPVGLPEGTQVEFEPRLVRAGDGEELGSLAEIYEVFDERFESGESDVAARHNEHQP